MVSFKMRNLELPFEAQEKFGVDETEGTLISGRGSIIRHSGEKWFYAAYPAEERHCVRHLETLLLSILPKTPYWVMDLHSAHADS